MTHVHEHSGPRTELRALFELAEDSAHELDSYIERGRVLVARDGDGILGHIQITDTGTAGEAGLEIDGIPLRDRVWLDLDLR